jgi:hypothetical protein
VRPHFNFDCSTRAAPSPPCLHRHFYFNLKSKFNFFVHAAPSPLLPSRRRHRCFYIGAAAAFTPAPLPLLRGRCRHCPGATAAAFPAHGALVANI